MNKLKMNLCVSASIFSAVLILVACDAAFSKTIDENKIREACADMAKPNRVDACFNMVKQWEIDVATSEKLANDYDRCRLDIALIKSAVKNIGGQ